MLSKSLLVVPVVVLVVHLACSANTHDPPSGAGGTAGSGGAGGPGGTSGQPGDDLLFVPSGLPNTLQDGEVGGGLTLVAFTLLEDQNGPALYAAVRNDGATPSCSPGMLTDFFDKAGQLVGTVGSTLQTRQFYRLSGGEIIPCLDSGEIAMSASTDFGLNVAIGQLGSLKHSFPAFTVDGIVDVAGLTISAVATVATSTGSAYTGVLTNGFDVSVSAPSVMIFPVNRVGRPLGAATGNTTTDIAPGGRWNFQTTTVPDPGSGYAAYPAASISNQRDGCDWQG